MTKEALKLALEAYLCREMPAGTVIGDPKWWAAKIANAIKEALAQRKVLASIKQEAETGLVIGDEIGMRDALTQILLQADEHLGISVMKEPS